MVQNGFRRSGLYTYRPFCDHCDACVPVRVEVPVFTPTRSQRRAFKRLSRMEVHIEPPRFDKDHYALYLSYQRTRHVGGGMDDDDATQYQQFLMHSHVDSYLLVFTETDPHTGLCKLKMITLMDVVQDGLSAVYTFYDAQDTSGLGTCSILWMIEHARNLGLPYVYLGYWIEQSPKMRYKAKFQPQQKWRDGQWNR
jgi:arginine-tRNA-protein transferase